MVFGSCYCGISGLEIKDGDICMYMPLEVSIRASGLGGDGLEQALFVPFAFSGEPCKVKFNGNFGMLDYAGDEPENSKERIKAERHFKFHEKTTFFMLVHLGFYEHLVKNYREGAYRTLAHCFMGGISRELLHKVERDILNEQSTWLVKIKEAKDKAETEIALSNYWKQEVPQYLSDIARVVVFMRYLGKRPAPNDANDQHEHGKLLAKYIREVKKAEKRTIRNTHTPNE
jgi:hypothetical protein